MLGVVPGDLIRWPGLDEASVGWGYDNDLELSSETVTVGAVEDEVAFEHDDDGLLTLAGDLILNREQASGLLTTTVLDEIETSQTHNSFGELQAFEATYEEDPIYSVTYDEANALRDDLGRVTQKTETLNGVTRVTQYFYDAAGRLEDVCEGGSWLRHFAYDSNSNRTLKRSCSFLASSCGTTCSNPVDVTTTFDDQDRIEEIDETYAYGYNLNGDLVSKENASGTTSLVYDAFGNLKEVGLPTGWRIEYTVDGRNRRVARRMYDDEDTLQDERRWLWQGQLRIVAELDGDGDITKRFVYGTKVNVPEYMVTYDPISHLETGTYRILTDQLGSLRLVVDVADGTVVQRMRHDEWGNVLENYGSGFTPFGFAGGLYDPATELVRFGARDYDPETGRWTGKDAILFEGDGWNLFGYVESNPNDRIDESGYGGFGEGGGWGGFLRPRGPYFRPSFPPPVNPPMLPPRVCPSLPPPLPPPNLPPLWWSILRIITSHLGGPGPELPGGSVQIIHIAPEGGEEPLQTA